MTSNGSSFFKRNYLYVIAFFLLAIPVVIYGKIQAGLSNNNSVRQWLPADFTATEIYEYFVQHFGTDEFAIVSWKGCTMDDPRLERFAQLLRKYRDADGDLLFARAQTGPEMVAELTGKPFDLKPEEAVRRLTGVVIGRDQSSTSVIVKLTEKGDGNRRVAVEAMRMLATNDLGIPAKDVHMAGDAVTNPATTHPKLVIDRIAGRLVNFNRLSLCILEFAKLPAGVRGLCRRHLQLAVPRMHDSFPGRQHEPGTGRDAGTGLRVDAVGRCPRGELLPRRAGRGSPGRGRTTDRGDTRLAALYDGSGDDGDRIGIPVRQPHPPGPGFRILFGAGNRRQPGFRFPAVAQLTGRRPEDGELAKQTSRAGGHPLYSFRPGSGGNYVWPIRREAQGAYGHRVPCDARLFGLGCSIHPYVRPPVTVLR